MPQNVSAREVTNSKEIHETCVVFFQTSEEIRKLVLQNLGENLTIENYFCGIKEKLIIILRGRKSRIMSLGDNTDYLLLANIFD